MNGSTNVILLEKLIKESVTFLKLILSVNFCLFLHIKILMYCMSFLTTRISLPSLVLTLLLEEVNYLA